MCKHDHVIAIKITAQTQRDSRKANELTAQVTRKAGYGLSQKGKTHCHRP